MNGSPVSDSLMYPSEYGRKWTFWSKLKEIKVRHKILTSSYLPITNQLLMQIKMKDKLFGNVNGYKRGNFGN